MCTKWPVGLSIAFSLSPYANAAALVVPNSNQSYPTATECEGPYDDGDMVKLTIYNENQLTPMLGKVITGVAFKVHTLQTTTWPSTTANYSNCDIYFGPGVHPGAKSLTFLLNYTGTRTQVRQGPISVPPNSIPTGNNFIPTISVTPYLYTGGHLVFEHRKKGFYGSDVKMTGIRQSDGEYNTNTSAVRAGVFSATTGSQHVAPVILFTYEDAPAITLSGNVILQDFIGAPASVPVELKVYPAGNPTPLYTTTLTLGAGGAYTVTLPGSIAAGNYDLAVDSSPFLRTFKTTQAVAPNSTNSQNFTMRNGDVDDSGEVDAVDIDLVIANFGALGGTGDLDGSAEVDAVDIDIAIANFGSVDE